MGYFIFRANNDLSKAKRISRHHSLRFDRGNRTDWYPDAVFHSPEAGSGTHRTCSRA